VSFEGHEYLACADATPHALAASACSGLDMQLVSVSSAAENNFLQQNVRSEWHQVWMGGTDASVEGEWRWPDGTLFWTGADNGSAPVGTYVNWRNVEPNDLNNGEDCLTMMTSSGRWNDADCEGGLAHAFVCESK
jgi:hypothetical protein